MLPFLNDIVRVQVSGAVLRSVLLNSISLLGDASAMSDPNGRFMQASSTLKYEWYFEDGRPTLGAVSVRPSDDADFEPLASEQSYTLAVTSYIAGGGDGYSMLTAVPQTPIGKTQAELTAEYLRLLGAARPGVPMPTEGRIVQKPTVVLLHVGILCAAPSHGNVTDRLAEREICDHVHHTIEMLNDKADGLYDELLPNAVIVAHEAYVGCNEGLAHSALSGLRAALPSMKAVIGPSCSNDVAAIAHKASEGAGEATVISGASTMQSLSNESEYPMLARTVTPDGHTATAHRTLMELYSWKRVGVLHSDSAWATEVSQLFVDGMQAASDEAVVLNEGDTEFSLSEAQSDGFDAGMLLKRLQKLDTRIVFLAAEPRAARAIFAAVYRERRLYGRGFAWLLPAVSEDMFLRDDGTVDLEAVYGAEGLLALRERADITSNMYEAYMERWKGASSMDACDGRSASRYCAADSDRSKLPGYAPFYADSVLLYAHAMHAIFRTAEPEADALYASMRTAEPFPSISGLLAIEESTADRLGSLTLLNMQLATVGGGPRAERRRLGGRAALASHGFLVEVGTYRTRTSDGSSGGLTLSPERPIVWPGGTRTPPMDSTPGKESAALMVALITVPLAVLFVSGVFMVWQKVRAWRQIRRQKEEAERQRQQAEKHRLEADVARMAEKMANAQAEQVKRELQRFQDAVVGVRAVVSSYVPSAAAVGAPPAPAPATDVPVNSEPTPTGGTAPPPALVPHRRLASWYWLEDTDRIGAHTPSEVLERDGRQYVRYAWSICRQLDEGYEQFERGTLSVPLDVDLTGAISSTGTEEKAYAKESGVRFRIDFATMQQTNSKTGFVRRVLRVEAPRRPENPPEGYPPLAGSNKASQSDGAAHDAPRDKMGLKALVGAATAAMRTGKAAGFVSSTERQADIEVVVVDPSAPIPADLTHGEDFLILEAGQLIQTSQIRADGWAHGKVVLDPMENRPASGTEGVSTTAGWFPLSHTALPNADQLEVLQRKMGDNALDALRPPSHWTRVRDPMVAELHALPDGDEKKAVVDAFMATLGGYSSLNVVSVQRVQNEAMWQSFAVKRQTILAREKDQASAARFERKWLFHGTDEDTVPKIIQQGFNRSFCGKNATAYGKGVYFARDSAYSASTTYSRPNQAREQHMFLCRVVVGEFCQGRSNALAPDVRSGHTLYDSTVDNVSNPNMYITYHDAQAFPEYLVKFKQ